MRRILLAVVLLAACNTRQRVAGVGAGMSFVGLTLSYSNEARADEEIGTQGKVGIALILTGLLTLFVAAALDEVAAQEQASQPPKPRVRQTSASPEQIAALRVQKRRDEAWQVTKQAQQAAREGDCKKVTELSAKVGSIDAEFYGDVFMKDVAIQRCFVPAEPPPPTPAPPIPTLAPPPS